MKLTQIIVSRREGLTISREELSVLVESYFSGLYLEFLRVFVNTHYQSHYEHQME